MNLEQVAAKTETKVEMLRSIYKKYNLLTEDIFTMQRGGKNIPIITRQGIDKIVSKDNIRLQYSLEFVSADCSCAVVKCTASKNGVEIQSFGEASPKNTPQAYPVAMAEKRAKSRCVLTLVGLYELGVFGEDEDFIDEK